MKLYSDSTGSVQQNDEDRKLQLEIALCIELLDEEVLDIVEVKCSPVRCHFNWTKMTSYKNLLRAIIPKTTQSPIVTGAKLSFDGEDEVFDKLENLTKQSKHLVLHESKNKLILNFETHFNADENFCDCCSKFKAQIHFHLASGTVLTFLITIYNDDGRNVSVQAPFTRVVSWSLGFFAVWIISIIGLQWGNKTTEVYRAIEIPVPLLLIVLTAIVSYLGIPRPDSIAQTLNTGFLEKLTTRLKYPEFYFDKFMVKLLRSYFFIFPALFIALITVLFNHNYTPFLLPNGLANGSTQIIWANQDLLLESSSNSPCQSIQFQMSSINDIADFYNQITCKIEELVPRKAPREFPKNLYRLDVERTCLAFIPSAEEKTFCIAKFALVNNEIHIDWIKFSDHVSTINFEHAINPKPPVIDLKEFENETDEILRAYHVFTNTEISELWRLSFSKDDLPPAIDIERKLQTIDRYAQCVSNKAKGMADFFELQDITENISLNSLEDVYSNFSSRLANIKKIRRPKDGTDFCPSFNTFWQPHELIKHASVKNIWNRPFNDDRNLGGDTNFKLMDPEKKPSRLHIIAYRDKRRELNIAIARWWLAIEFFAHDRALSSDGSRALAWGEFIRSINSFWKPEKGCRHSKLIGEDSFCNAVRRYYADLMYALLSFENLFNRPGELHDLIKNDLVVTNIESDMTNYMLLTGYLNLMTEERYNYFSSHLAKSKTDRFACMFKEIYDSQWGEWNFDYEKMTEANFKDFKCN